MSLDLVLTVMRWRYTLLKMKDLSMTFTINLGPNRDMDRVLGRDRD
jgi:hypothetical protein